MPFYRQYILYLLSVGYERTFEQILSNPCHALEMIRNYWDSLKMNHASLIHGSVRENIRNPGLSLDIIRCDWNGCKNASCIVAPQICFEIARRTSKSAQDDIHNDSQIAPELGEKLFKHDPGDPLERMRLESA